MKSDWIWIDGKLLPYEQATVHILNPTLHYGTGVFEGIRCYATPTGSAVFRLREHLERFLDSLQIVGLYDYPYSVDELHQAVHRTILANGYAECYIRPLVYMDGPLTLTLDDWRPVTGIAVWEWGPFLGIEAAENGVRMMVSSITRHHPNVMMTKAKISGNYVNSTFAKTFAKRAGFDETVMLDPQGYVAECSGENLFMVRGGVLYTPPRTTVLEGITRDSLITLAGDLGYQVVEERISRDQLYIADEVFVCGTAAEIVPVREIDFRAIGQDRHWPVTRALQGLFHETVRGQGRRSAEWLDFVDGSRIDVIIDRGAELAQL
ncbi:MAG: branched-chain amino acid transaminase [Anaerolineales bacterium]|nr:branched-chain amino acid transaminase [Anaerolineales bacterium]